MSNFNLNAQDFDKMDQQLNSSNNFSQNPQAQSIQNTNPSMLNQVINSPGIQAVLGAGDAIRNTLASGANIFPGVNISPVKTGSGTAYNIGNIVGNLGAFTEGGEALDTARALAESIPYAGQIAKSLGGAGLSGVARRSLGTGIYGGLENNQNRLENAGIGAGASAALDAIPGIGGLVAKGAQYFMPQRTAEGIVNELSGGQSLPDATKSVLSSVKNAYTNVKGAASNAYNSFLNSVPDSSIYASVNKIYGVPSGKQDALSALNGNYFNLPENITDNYTSELKNLHNNFISNPTFSNAHQLQSELGAVSRQLNSGVTPPSIATINEKNSIDSARKALQSDMTGFLQSQGNGLSDQYNNLSSNYLQNVVPYKTNPKIYSIAKGDITNVKPSTLADKFAAPDDDLSKVISDLPSGTVEKILYSKLGQTVPTKSAQGLINSYQNLQQQGLGEYISPALSAKIDDLGNRIKARNALQMAAAGLSAAALGGAHGSPIAGAMMGLGAGAIASPFMNYIGKRLPIDNISQAVSNGLSTTYPYVRNAIAANYLNNRGVQNGS